MRKFLIMSLIKRPRFTVLKAIGLQGVSLVQPTLGEYFVVAARAYWAFDRADFMGQIRELTMRDFIW